MSLKDFLSRPDSKYRIAAIAGAAILGLSSLFLGISIAGAILGMPGYRTGPGAFFAASYGLLAFAIPAYLFFAAFILADNAWRPDRIFILGAVIFPFITLAVGVSFMRDFEVRSQEFALLDLTGRAGFSFIIVALTVFESLMIAVLKILLFPNKGRSAGRPGGRHAAGEGPVAGVNQQPGRRQKSKSLLLPAPASQAAPGTSLKDIYTESAAAHQGSPRNEGPPISLKAAEQSKPPSVPPAPPPTKSNPAKSAPADHPTLVNLPELKPLASAAALNRLDSGRTGNTPDDNKTEELEELGSAEDIEELEELEADQTEELEELEADEVEELEAYQTEELEKLEADEAEELEELEADEVEELEELEADQTEELEEPTLDEADDGEEPDGPAVTVSSPFPELFGSALTDAKPGVPEAPEPEIVSIKPKTIPRKKIRSAWRVPVEILNQYPDGEYWIIDDATREAAVTLRETLEEFKIQAEVTGIRKGPVITMFEILPAPGVKLSKIVNLQDNIALRLAASSVRIVAPIPGKHAVGIEVPNAKRNIVSFREIIEGELHREGKKLEIPVVLGKDITGEGQTIDLVQMPHLLIAGSTGSGKSVCVNSMILSILYQRAPAECRLILIDPKIVELKLYNDIPHLLTPVITEPKKAFQALQYCIYEMERRYACLDSMGVRDIRSYNKRIKEREVAAEHMPYIVVVIDEFADLMATTGKELESTVARLAAMSRAVGIHLVLATQRPSIDVITGLIKANIPSRIAFMVAGKMDSRIIIDMVGAEKLLGKGDMLYAGATDPFPIRMQGAFISEEEVEAVVEYVKTLGKPDYIDDEIFYDEDEDDASPSLFSDGEDPLYDKALEVVFQQGKASASYIQRRLKIGYNRAARLVEEMEHHGVVGPAQGSKPRELLRAYSS
ncbi:hypothetical protein AGMMS49546_10640 [Spirochaetia bacterium]|nr:hypothetical protein AGMMS49546_10640 [Spirochaetia bacterium]